MSESQDWETTLEHAINNFGGQPLGPNLEPIIRKHHTEHPAIVQAAINRIANAYAAGTIRSPWGALKADLERRQAAAPAVKQGNDQQRAAQRAEQWMRAAGLHFDRWTEIEDELFGDRGSLREHPSLKGQMQALYEEHRPRGLQAETDDLARAAKYRDDQANAKKKTPPTTTTEALQEAA